MRSPPRIMRINFVWMHISPHQKSTKLPTLNPTPRHTQTRNTYHEKQRNITKKTIVHINNDMTHKNRLNSITEQIDVKSI